MVVRVTRTILFVASLLLGIPERFDHDRRRRYRTMDIIIGLILALMGVAVCFSGLRVFFVVLPVIGFVLGFYAGAAGVAIALGEGFLASFTGILMGLLVGVLFATISYAFWYIGALLSAGSTGALVGSWWMSAMGVEGWIAFLFTMLIAVLFFGVAFMLALPIYVVVVNTAFLGAVATVAGVMLVFNQLGPADLGSATAWRTIEQSAFWLLVWFGLMTVGIVSQLRLLRTLTLPKDPWTPAKPA
jgi:hypothetical protein